MDEIHSQRENFITNTFLVAGNSAFALIASDIIASSGNNWLNPIVFKLLCRLLSDEDGDDSLRDVNRFENIHGRHHCFKWLNIHYQK